jgi:DNA processing protein
VRPALPCPERAAALALALADGVGPSTYQDLVARFGNAERALDAHVDRRGRDELVERASSAIERGAAAGARLVLLGDADYPARLLELHDPPPFLFRAGSWETIADPLVAIVGTRDSTSYGERVTREIATALARGGAGVISGMARGIDGTAHRACLEAGGRTAAVLGTGIDIAYPAAHRSLRAAIAARGLVLSELLPGDRANAGSFPRRNRIIAALASVTIVIEAGAQSGALITAGHALDLGRTLAAVPGQIDSPQSVGGNELLRDGAHVIASVADALKLVGLELPPRAPAADRPPAELAVWKALGNGPLDIDSLAGIAGLPARDCLAAVTALELAGSVECLMSGAIRRR